jgi:hypothetical protein
MLARKSVSAAWEAGESFGSNSAKTPSVAAAPEEAFSARDPLDVVGDDAAALEDLELLGAEVVADRADRPHLGEEAGRQREVDGGAPEHAVALPERGLDRVEGD